MLFSVIQAVFQVRLLLHWMAPVKIRAIMVPVGLRYSCRLLVQVKAIALEAVPVVLQSGRFHLYEGHAAATVALPARTFAELTLDDHAAIFSLVSFLLQEHPTAFAGFLGGVKGQLDEAGHVGYQYSLSGRRGAGRQVSHTSR